MSTGTNSRRPRVLHVGPTPFFSDRGCHVRIRGVITGLERAGAECLLVTYAHGRDVAGVRTERVRRIPGYTQRVAGPSPFKYIADILLFIKTLSAMRRFKPDLIHGHLHEGALLGWASRTVYPSHRLPVLFDMQGSLVGELEEYGHFDRIGILRRPFEWIERFIDRRPEAIACSSRSSLEIARDRFGVNESRLHLVADGVDVAESDPSTLRELRRDLQLPEHRSIVAYTGSLLAVKGLATLHEVVRQAAAAEDPVHFLLVGYPVAATKTFLSDNGLGGSCTLTGRVPYERIGDYLGLADIALDPKGGDSGEASGKLVNYMGAALPVVCFDNENNRELLGRAGCYSPVHSAAGLVAQIRALVADRERAREFGRQAQARVRERFSWDASAEALLAIYRTILGRAGETSSERSRH